MYGVLLNTCDQIIIDTSQTLGFGDTRLMQYTMGCPIMHVIFAHNCALIARPFGGRATTGASTIVDLMRLAWLSPVPVDVRIEGACVICLARQRRDKVVGARDTANHQNSLPTCDTQVVRQFVTTLNCIIRYVK